jgi:spermidine/putrescine transport system ATP-binding protein
VRPEFLRFVDKPGAADNAMNGTIYNEYSLGSRIQYQVRVGDKTLLVELSRGNGWKGTLDTPVLVGWDATDAIVVAA